MGLGIKALLAAASVAALAMTPNEGVAATTTAEVLPTNAELQAAVNGSFRLRRAVTVDGIRRHLRQFNTIGRNNGNTRASGTPGYDASVAYVRGKLRQAGYEVRVQSFPFVLFEETAPSTLARVSPDPETFANGPDFLTLQFSGGGDVTGRVVPTRDIAIPPTPEPSSDSGCEAEDFPPPPSATSVALITRGTCTFGAKAANAAAAGYAAAIIMNEGQPGRQDVVSASVGVPPPGIPAVFASFAVGRELYENSQGGATTVRVAVRATNTPVATYNVLADSPRGRAGRVVAVGGHLDSVTAGPGINDNGSGTGTILEVALQIARLDLPLRNKLRFAFWGGEEAGLVGSTYYIENLPEAQLARIDSYLNFDMVGSPNFARFIYDGDNTLGLDVEIPPGSAAIERQFEYFFRSQGLASEPTAFDGRSDYGPFIAVGIPAGGLFTGAEGIKTPEQVRLYGGRAGGAYDPCYHEACDKLGNINNTALDQMSDAVAYATMVLANRSAPLPPRDAAAMDAARVAATKALYRGHRAVR